MLDITYTYQHTYIHPYRDAAGAELELELEAEEVVDDSSDRVLAVRYAKG